MVTVYNDCAVVVVVVVVVVVFVVFLTTIADVIAPLILSKRRRSCGTFYGHRSCYQAPAT